jgi:DNA ligase-associated metallophosphoesterase
MSEREGAFELEVASEVLLLLPERAAYWARSRTLLVADPHFGKAATFRASAIPVPRGTTTEGLARLARIVARTGAARIIFLGDYLHARAGRSPETLRVLADWRSANPRLDLVLVRGNHDRRAGDPPSEAGVTCVDAPLAELPFVFAHHPATSPEGYLLAGHLHPGATLSGRGRMRERVPCFWFGREYGVLPAFGEFTGLAAIAAQPGDRVIAVAEATLVEVVVGELPSGR